MSIPDYKVEAALRAYYHDKPDSVATDILLIDLMRKALEAAYAARPEGTESAGTERRRRYERRMWITSDTHCLKCGNVDAMPKRRKTDNPTPAPQVAAQPIYWRKYNESTGRVRGTVDTRSGKDRRQQQTSVWYGRYGRDVGGLSLVWVRESRKSQRRTSSNGVK